MDLQPLFRAPVVEQVYIDRDYSGFGNDVWVVTTRDERVVVRVAAHAGAEGPFWTGASLLFGVESTDLNRLREISDVVNAAGSLRAPRVLRTGVLEGRAFAITELMPGRHIDSFDDLNVPAAEAFGRALALAHGPKFEICGAPGSHLSYPVAEFHARAADAIEWLAQAYRNGAADVALAASCAVRLRHLATPSTTSLVLVDIGGSQYLWDTDGPTAVVDTEVYAYAPREFELIVLESDNGAAFCEAFRRGYESVSPLPCLAPLREPYRCLIALMEVNGRTPLEEALAAPLWFDC